MDEKEKWTTQCGIGSWRPSFLKVFNKPAWFLVSYSMVMFFNSMALGMNQVMLPSLQQLFNLTTTQMAYILISNDLSGLVVSFVFGHLSSKGKTLWIAGGLFTTVISIYLTSSIQLFTEVPADGKGNATANGGTGAQMCNLAPYTGNSEGALTSDFYAERNNGLFWMFLLGGLLQGIGNTPLLVSGMTYLDEVMTEKKLGPALATSNVANYLGFPISFVVGAYLLSQYVTLGAVPDGVTPSSSRWVGAWWVGFFAPACAMVIVGTPLALFPTQMPAAKHVLEAKIVRGEVSEKDKNTELNRSFSDLIKDIIPTIKRLSRNISLVLLIAAESVNNIFLSSLPYEAKIKALSFQIPVASVAMIMGGLQTGAMVLGLAFGGWVVGRLKSTGYDLGKKCLFLVCIMQFITLCSPFFAFFYCTQHKVVGVDKSYMEFEDISKITNLNAECNQLCDCTTDFYDPVCDLEKNVMYFSPCHAGCSVSHLKQDNKTVVFKDCSCGLSDLQPGPCPREQSCDKKQWGVLIAQSFTTVILYISQYPALHIAYLRIVPEIDRSAVQGMRQVFTRAFGFVLGPILFGALIDGYCSVWRGGSNTGSCWIYDIKGLLELFIGGQFGLRVGALICYIISWTLYPACPLYSTVDNEMVSSFDQKTSSLKNI